MAKLPRLLLSLTGGRALALAFDESQHPREAAGSDKGGEFIEKKSAKYENLTKGKQRIIVVPAVQKRACDGAVNSQKRILEVKRGGATAAVLVKDVQVSKSTAETSSAEAQRAYEMRGVARGAGYTGTATYPDGRVETGYFFEPRHVQAMWKKGKVTGAQ